jgi:hypothetical protein
VELLDAGTAEIGRHLGERVVQAPVQIPDAGGRGVIGQHGGGQRVPTGPGQESPVPAGAGGDGLYQGNDQRTDQPGQIVGADAGQQAVPLLVDRSHAGLEHGGDEPGAVAEVVVGRRVVPLSGRRVHVAQGHRLDAPLGEQLLGGLQDRQPGRSSGCHTANLS